MYLTIFKDPMPIWIKPKKMCMLCKIIWALVLIFLPSQPVKIPGMIFLRLKPNLTMFTLSQAKNLPKRNLSQKRILMQCLNRRNVIYWLKTPRLLTNSSMNAYRPLKMMLSLNKMVR